MGRELTPVAVCFEQHRSDGLVWAVKWPIGDIDDDRDWIFVRQVLFYVPVMTVYRGPDAPQPRAYLLCSATERIMHGDYLVIR